MDSLNGIKLVCQDCGHEFVFSAGEQIYYAGKGFTPPKRCKDCRDKRKQKRKAQQQLSDTQELQDLLTEFRVIGMDSVPCDPAHTLFIIGNGFDLMHKVKSSYRNFESTIGRNNPLRHALVNYLKVKDLWADFEEALAHLDVGAMRNDATVDLQLDLFDAYSPHAHASDFFMATETIMKPALQIVRDLPRRFRMWVESLTVQTTERPLQGLITNSKVLCFNYTEFIEDLYGVSQGNVCYIHGCRKKQQGHPKEKLILGHWPVWEYEGETPPRRLDCLRPGGRGAFMDVAYEATTQHLMYYDQETTKDCASIISAHPDFFDGLKSVRNIIVIGHSISPVDWDYFRKISQICPDAHWYIGYHGVSTVRNLRKLMSMLGVDGDQISLFAT